MTNRDKLKKYAYTMLMRKKIKDLVSIYNYGYSLELTDSDISPILNEIGF